MDLMAFPMERHLQKWQQRQYWKSLNDRNSQEVLLVCHKANGADNAIMLVNGVVSDLFLDCGLSIEIHS